MEAYHTVEVLGQAITHHGKPDIVNADQGSQLTGKDWVDACENHEIKVSHDGVGRCIDNIRVERLCGGLSSMSMFTYIVIKRCGS